MRPLILCVCLYVEYFQMFPRSRIHTRYTRMTQNIYVYISIYNIYVLTHSFCPRTQQPGEQAFYFRSPIVLFRLLSLWRDSGEISLWQGPRSNLTFAPGTRSHESVRDTYDVASSPKRHSAAVIGTWPICLCRSLATPAAAPAKTGAFLHLFRWPRYCPHHNPRGCVVLSSNKIIPGRCS